MEIKPGAKKIKIDGKEESAIIEYVFNAFEIYVFQGQFSTFDILIKYQRSAQRIRSPKHIHWTVDLLMKISAKPRLARGYVSLLLSTWKAAKPLSDNSFHTLKGLVEKATSNVDLTKYKSLDNNGLFPADVLYVLMVLLSAQEKTNRQDAHLFGDILEKLSAPKPDIYSVLSLATYGGKK